MRELVETASTQKATQTGDSWIEIQGDLEVIADVVMSKGFVMKDPVLGINLHRSKLEAVEVPATAPESPVRE